MTGNQSKFIKPEIVIIGGGPTGSAAAIWCLKHDIPVTIIESELFPRDRPGEALHPGIESLFVQLDILDRIQAAEFLRYPGTWVNWDTRKTFIPFGNDINGPWLGYQIRRLKFDSILLEHARSLGATIIQPCHVNGVIRKGERLAGLKTSVGEYSTDFIIDAAGGGHFLARQLEMPIERYSPIYYVFYGYAKGDYQIRDCSPALTATRGGWLWTAMVELSIYQWVRLMFQREIIRYDWLPDEFRVLKPASAARGADASWRCVTKPAGPGYFIAGDAFGVLDPASFHGLLRGIMSGIMVAQTIVKILKNPFDLKKLQSCYNEWLFRWFSDDVIQLRSLYSSHPYYPKPGY